MCILDMLVLHTYILLALLESLSSFPYDVGEGVQYFFCLLTLLKIVLIIFRDRVRKETKRSPPQYHYYYFILAFSCKKKKIK